MRNSGIIKIMGKWLLMTIFRSMHTWTYTKAILFSLIGSILIPIKGRLSYYLTRLAEAYIQKVEANTDIIKAKAKKEYAHARRMEAKIKKMEYDIQREMNEDK